MTGGSVVCVLVCANASREMFLLRGCWMDPENATAISTVEESM